MPPIGPPGTHKRRPRKRRPAPRRAPASLVPGVGSSLRNAALNAPARPLSRAKKPPRVVHVEHAAKRASRQIPGIADVRPTPRPLQAQPPRRPLGAKPRGRSRPGSRKERQKGINRVARSMLTQPEPKREKAKQSFIGNMLSSKSPVGAGLRQNNPVIGVLSSVAGRAALNVGRVLFGDPGKQGPKLLRDTGESIVSIPAGLARSVTDPSGAAKNLVKDYDRRYRPLLEGDDAAFRKRMEKEGVAPEVFDLAGLAAGEGAVAGRALQSAAKTGSLGRTAARIATERPALQLSGGTVKAQAVSDNFFRNVVRHGVDTARKNKQASRAARPEASAVVREAEEAGNVTKLFKGTQERAQTRAVAQNKGRKLQAMKAEQQAEVGESTKAIRSLSKPEQRAFKYAMQYGATTPEAARRVLARHRENVALNRVAHEARTGEKIPGRQNEVPEIDYLLEHADKAFTPRLAAVMRQERVRATRAAIQDPGVDLSQAELRRQQPVAELLGVTRGRVPTQHEVRPRVIRSTEVSTRLKPLGEVTIERGARPHTHDYQPAPAKINQRTWYHGTNVEGLTAEQLQGGGTDIANLFGQGIYLTDDAKIAGEYAAARTRRGGAAHVYAAKVKVRKALDMQSKVDPAFARILADRVRHLAGIGSPEDADRLLRIAKRADTTNEALYREFTETVGELSHHEGIPKSELVEDFQQIASDLREAGFDALTHEGGKRVGKSLHQVVILLDPENLGASLSAGRQAESFARAAEPARLRVTRYGVERVETPVTRTIHERVEVAPARGETTAEFLRRVDTEAKRLGLEAPGYFPSEKRAEGVFSAFAVGGRQAVKGPGRYTGALTQTGRESGALDVFPRGVARNIKRKYNWNLVAENFDQHAFKWSKGKTIEQLKDEMERRGIDPSSVAFWNPRKFREEQQAGAGLEGRDVEAGQVSPEAGDVHTAAQLATNPSAFKNSTGWSLIPKAVHDEIMQDTRPSGAGWRGFDIAKGKVSRILLGNPGWLQFQTASNAFLTGLSGTGPADAVKAQVWWRKLSQEQKRAIEPYLGIHRWYDDQTHLGAAANNRMVNAYRAFKETGLYRAAHKANPLDALFKADNAQNNFFRKAVFYNKAKREAYKRMGQESGQIMALQKRVARILSLPPEKMMDAVVNDAETFERIAEHTNKFLGDYTTYTAKERRVLGRTVMFYGFLRYSVKFTLYTMPIEHPIVSSILTQIGRLERDEQKKIFGSDVPPWELGNLYTEDGRKVALARLNPFFNANQFEGGPGALVGMTSPLAQVVANQLAGKNVAFGRPYTAHGSGAYIEQSKDLDAATRAKIALAETAQIFPPYRLAAKGGIPGIEPLRGKQTSTSSLFFPDPVRYKRTTKVSEEAHQRNEQRKREEAAGGVGRQLREQLLPLSGVEGGDIIRRAREFDEAERKKKRKKKPAGPRDLLGGAPGTGQLPDLLAP